MGLAPALGSRLEQLQTSPNIGAFEELLKDIGGQDEPAALEDGYIRWFDSTFNNNLSIVARRPLLTSLITALKDATTTVRIVVGRYATEKLRSAVASYEEQDTALREMLAEAFIVEEEYIEAAKILQGVQLESSQRKVSDEDKFEQWIRICRLYLEEDDTTTAETFLNRAKNLLYQVNNSEAHLKFKLSQARISDSQRRFIEAGTVYYDISLVPLLAEEERDLTLGKAIVCAVLAPAGTSRTALLRKLHRDERAQTLQEFSMLENMYLGRIVTPEQAEAFTYKLDSHQLAQNADGSTVLSKAVIEHNLLGISNLYESISSVELGMLLGLDPIRAEEYAAHMVEQTRLIARIDHMESYIYFNDVDKRTSVCRFDERIRLLLEDVERVASLVTLVVP